MIILQGAILSEDKAEAVSRPSLRLALPDEGDTFDKCLDEGMVIEAIDGAVPGSQIASVIAMIPMTALPAEADTREMRDDGVLIDDASLVQPSATDPLETIIGAWHGISSQLPKTESSGNPISSLTGEAGQVHRNESQSDQRPIRGSHELMPSDAEPADVTLALDVRPVSDNPAPPMPATDLTDPVDLVVCDILSDLAASPLNHDTASTTRVAALDWRPSTVHAPALIRQIADALVTMTDDRIEVTLSPEELGRIRITLGQRDHAPQVVVWAERPEVLDNLRRNAAVLLQSFDESGIGNAAFEFRQDRPDRQDREWHSGATNNFDADVPVLPVMRQAASLVMIPVGARLDIRI